MQFNWRVIETVVKLIHFLHVELLWSRVFVLSAPCGIRVGCMQRGWYLPLEKSNKAILVLTQHDLLVWTHAKGLNVNTFPLKAQILAKAKSSMTEVMQQATGWGGIPKIGMEKEIIAYYTGSSLLKQSSAARAPIWKVNTPPPSSVLVSTFTSSHLSCS